MCISSSYGSPCAHEMSFLLTRLSYIGVALCSLPLKLTFPPLCMALVLDSVLYSRTKHTHYHFTRVYRESTALWEEEKPLLDHCFSDFSAA